MLGRYTQNVTRQSSSLLGDAAPLFEGADISTANLETTVFSEELDLPKAPGHHIYFSSPPASLNLVSEVDVFNLANNHVGDYLSEGVAETLRNIENSGRKSVGGGNSVNEAFTPYIEDVQGARIGFLGFTDVARDSGASLFEAGPAALELRRALLAIRQTSAISDLVVVHIHWGEEYMTSPTKRQRQIAAAFSDAGANIIVGHHPHVLQQVELVGNTLVFFSLGNLVSDQGWSDTSETIVAEVRYDTRSRVADVFLHPFLIKGTRPAAVSNTYYSAKIERKVLKNTNIFFTRGKHGLDAQVTL